VFRSRREPTIENEKIDRWIVLAGFMALVILLIIEGLALYQLLDLPMRSQPAATQWPETIMRLFFGRSR
jgi:hypothetical protein